jgi:hypothetical protein
MKHIEKDSTGKPYADYSSWEYFNKIDALSNSGLKEFIKGPEYYGLGMKSKIEFLIGHAVEDLLYQSVFDDGRFDNKFFIDESGYSRPSEWEAIIEAEDKEPFYKRKKDGSLSVVSTNDWIKLADDNKGKNPLKADEYADIKGMVDSLLKLEIKFIHNGQQFSGIKYSDLIAKSLVEQPIVWEDDLGIVKKCMPDLIVDPGIGALFLCDLKTFRENPKSFNKQANNLWYDIQAVHYREGVAAKYGSEVTKMHFIVVEKNFPYVCGISTFKDEENYDKCEFSYELDCRDYQDWNKSGRPLTGQIDYIQEIRIYNKILED